MESDDQIVLICEAIRTFAAANKLNSLLMETDNTNRASVLLGIFIWN